MKTKLARISKRSLATVLAFLMIFSTLMVGTISTANAATIIYFDDTNTQWGSVYVWSNSSPYWDNSNGSGSNGRTLTQMTKVSGTSNVYSASLSSTGAYVAFVKDNQAGYNNFWKTKAAYRADFSSSNPTYVPSATSNGTWNQTTYYSTGEWKKAPVSISVGKVTSYTNGTVSKSPNDSKVVPGTSVTFTATPNDGYFFDGWYTAAAGSGSPESTSASYTKEITAATSLYAKFSPISSASVYLLGLTSDYDWDIKDANKMTYNSTTGLFEITRNLYSGDTVYGTNQNEPDGSGFKVYTSGDYYGSADGYTINGMSYNNTTLTSADSKNVCLQTKDLSSDTSGKVPYKFTYNYSTHQITVYYPMKVTFNANDHGTAPAKQYVASGEKASTPTAPTATGWTFGGWYKESTCTNAWNFSSDTVTADKTLYAKWTRTTYTISYDKGANGTGTVESTTKTHGTNATLSSSTFTRSGYTQDGWATSDGGAKAYNLGATNYSTEGDATLYPHWTANVYTISYNAGTGGSGTVASTSKTHGTNATLSSSTFTRTGYTQDGWATSDGGEKAYNLGATNYSTEGNATLYPHWTENSHTITIANNINATTSSVTGHPITTCTVTAPTVSGYHITGWVVTSGSITIDTTPYAQGSTISTAGNLTNVKTTGDATLTAQFVINDALYNIGAAEVSITGASSASLTASAASTSNVSSTNGTTVTAVNGDSSNYTFTGWTVKAGGSGSFTDASSLSTTFKPASAGATPVANFTEKTYTVTVSSADSTMGNVSANVSPGKYTSKTITATANTGYHFVSWTKSSNNITIANANSASTSVTATGTGTVTANFAANNYAISHSTDNTKYTVSIASTGDYNSTVEFTVTPKTYYQIDSVTSSDVTITNPTTNTYRFTMPNKAVNITIAASETTYAVTRSAGTGGSVTTSALSAGGATAVSLGTVTENTGYTFSTWEIISGTGTLSNATSKTAATIKATTAVSVRANFTPVSHSVTTSGSYVTITPDKASAATAETVTFTVTPDTGYAISGTPTVTVGSNSATVTNTSGNNYSFTVPADSNAADDIVISATVAQIAPVIKVTYNNYSGTSTSETATSDNQSATISKRRAVSFSLDNASSYNGSTTLKLYRGDTLVQTSTVTSGFTSIAAGSLVTGQYKVSVTQNGTELKSSYYIDVTANDYQTVTVTSPAYGGTVTVTYTNDFGTTNRTVTPNAGASSTIYVKSGANVTVTAGTGTLSTVYLNGTAQGSTTFAISSTSTITADFYSDYYFMGAGEDWSKANSRRFVYTSTADVLQFEKDYTAGSSYSQGENQSGFKIVYAPGSGSWTYYGCNTTIDDHTPDNDKWYIFKSANDNHNCGFNATTGGKYTFQWNTSSHALNVIEPQTEYGITYTYNSSQVDVTGDTAKINGKTATFTATAKSGYRISSVVVKDASNNIVSHDVAGSTYSFTMPNNAVTVTVNTVQTHTVTVDLGTNVTRYTVSGSNYNSTQAFTIDHGSGFTVSGLTFASGYADATTDSKTIAAVNADATIRLRASQIDYTVTAAKAPSGIDTGNTITVNSAASATVHYNDTVNVRVTVATGYKLTSVKHGSTTVTMSGTTGTVTGSYTYTKTNGTSTTSETVTATFEAADPTVNTPTFSASHYAALSTYYTGDTYTVSSTATNNTSLTFQLIKSGEDPVAIADPNNFTISEAGTYTIKAIATNEPAGVASKSANASTANFTVVADSAPTSKAITAYIDFHDNTPVSPSIVINGSTSASLTRVGSSTVYSASVTVPYNYGPIAGSVNTALETSFPATITTDGNAYNVTISNASNKFINATTNEVWIEAQGVLGSTTSEPRKTTVNNSSDTKRIYVYKHSSYSDDQWYDVYLHYWGGATSTEWNTSSMPEMSYLTSYTNSSSQTYYVYYTDVPADTTHVKVAGTLLGGDQLNTSDAFEKELGDNNAVWLNNGGGCTMNATTAPTISSYTSVVTIQTGQTTSIAPTATGTVTYSSGDPTKVSVASNGTITAVAAGSTTLTITATGDRGDTVTATTNITVSDSSLTGSFIVMSYSSQQSQFSVDSNSKVRIDSLSTVLHGSKASGSSSTVRGGGIVTSTGSDYSKIYTVKYASPETSTGYGGLSLRVTANYTIANEDCYFDGWYVGGVASTVYTTEDDAIKVDGNNFVLKFIEENTFTVTINYNYRVWNTANGIPYNAQFADDEHTTAKTKTETVKFKAATIENKDALEMIVNNCPSIINDYFNYKLVTKPYSAADTTSDAYKYGFTVTTSGKTCTINANLKRSAHKYVVTVNGHKYANTTYTYQKALEIKAGEVMNAAGVYEFNDDTVLNWYDGTQRMATGTSYKLRVTGDTTLTTTLGQSGDNNNGKSIISHKSHELKLEDSGVQKLIQNFYIADFINAELGGDEGEAEFVGGGVLYYAVNKTTGKATKATITNNSGEASSDDLEDVINRVVDGNYTTLKNNVTDSTSKVVCRYVPMTSGSSVYKYSQSLQAYQYIMSQKIINSSDYENYKYRMYSYFIYRVGSKYYISVSDNYADANLYEAE